jgi:anti-sigma factor RsiW
MASLQTACPAASDEVAEAFVRGTLSPDRATFFGRHIACCPKCAEEVENTRAFVLAMCDAFHAIRLSSATESDSIRFCLTLEG